MLGKDETEVLSNYDKIAIEYIDIPLFISADSTKMNACFGELLVDITIMPEYNECFDKFTTKSAQLTANIRDTVLTKKAHISAVNNFLNGNYDSRC